MTKKVYNKLVRDKIPENLADKGLQTETYTLDDPEYFTELLRKLIEEAQEASCSPDDKSLLEELADLEEVMYAILALKGISKADLHEARVLKLKDRGGFAGKIFLKSVTEEDQT